MLDDVPVQVWLLLVIAAFGIGSARYVYEHIAHAPSRRDITQAPEDLSWRTTGQFFRNLAMLAGLAALAIFIFTPAAEQLASSHQFFPSLMAALGLTAALTVVPGLVTRQIRPFVKGFDNAYERDEHPKRYWASMAWNVVFGCFIFWVSYQENQDASARTAAAKCVTPEAPDGVDRALSACAESIRLRPDDAARYVDRALVYLDLNALDQAVADLTRAHELDPKNPWALANRGIVHVWNGEGAEAQKDFDAARSIDPGNPVMLRGEAALRRDAGDVEGAVERLTRSMAREPDDLFALRTRSELYWELGEVEKSAEDDARWVYLTKQAAAKSVPRVVEVHGSP